MLAPVSILVLIALSILIYFAAKYYRKIYGWLLAAIPIGLMVAYLYNYNSKDPHILTFSYPWMDIFDVGLHFRTDGLSYLFSFLILGIGGLIVLYAWAYMKTYEHKERMMLILVVFMASMLGMVNADDMILLFVFWELTSVTSFLLVGFNHTDEKSRKAAQQALLITVFGGLALMAGFILLAIAGGSYRISELVSNAGAIKSSNLYIPAFLLILFGAITKSAQFPFHFWLPGAMQAPTPVSAYLHSATMVKAGVYLLMRLNPVLGGTDIWHYSISLFGVLTMFIGAYLAISQTDLKKILAYTTISALGILMLLIGIDTNMSLKAASVFIIVHALYKAALFTITGIIDKSAGTRDLSKLSNLFNPLPVVTIAALFSLFSMSGLPPFLGFIGKELIYEAQVLVPDISNILLFFGVSANAFMIFISLLLIYRVFYRPQSKKVHYVNLSKVNPMLTSGPILLSFSGLLFGIFPNFFTRRIVQDALYNVRAEDIAVKLKLWHGFNLVLLLSLSTILIGFILFVFRTQVIKIASKINETLFKIDLSDLFNQAINEFLNFTRAKTPVIQHGNHRYYLLVIFLFTSILVWFRVMRFEGWADNPVPLRFSFYVVFLSVMIAVAALIAALSKSRLVAIINMGIAGYATALIYLFYGAIDVAITLILVDTLFIVLFVMMVQKLPAFANLSSKITRLRDGFIAILVGGFITVLVLTADLISISPPISDYFIENSSTKGYGKNIVNVILVDFRALDTLGEITVLAIAAVGILALIKSKQKSSI
jgi:multicomponent Na+:H+ antiporter subunit A